MGVSRFFLLRCSDFPENTFPVSCLEGKGIAASLYKCSTFVIRYVYRQQAPDPSYFLVKVLMPSARLSISNVKTLFYPLWGHSTHNSVEVGRGFTDLGTCWSLFTVVAPFDLCCVNEVAFQLSHLNLAFACLLKQLLLIHLLSSLQKSCCHSLSSCFPYFYGFKKKKKFLVFYWIWRRKWN